MQTSQGKNYKKQTFLKFQYIKTRSVPWIGNIISSRYPKMRFLSSRHRQQPFPPSLCAGSFVHCTSSYYWFLSCIVPYFLSRKGSDNTVSCICKFVLLFWKPLFQFHFRGSDVEPFVIITHNFVISQDGLVYHIFCKAIIF